MSGRVNGRSAMPGRDPGIHSSLPCGNLRSGVVDISRLPRALGDAVIAARIIMHRAGLIAMCSAVGAGEIFDPIGEVGVGVAEACGIAGVAEAAGGRELELEYAQ